MKTDHILPHFRITILRSGAMALAKDDLLGKLAVALLEAERLLQTSRCAEDVSVVSDQQIPFR